jgi:hypothetical protein
LGADSPSDGFLLTSRGAIMRACFLGQNICALGFGVAMVQSPPLDEAAEAHPEDRAIETGPEIPPPGIVLENRMVRDLRRRDLGDSWG